MVSKALLMRLVHFSVIQINIPKNLEKNTEKYFRKCTPSLLSTGGQKCTKIFYFFLTTDKKIKWRKSR